MALSNLSLRLTYYPALSMWNMVHFSSEHISSCGIPQGSVLDPLLFVMHTTPFSTLIVSKPPPLRRWYSTFFSFHPRNFNSSIAHLQTALQQICKSYSWFLIWTLSNALRLVFDDTDSRMSCIPLNRIEPRSWIIHCVQKKTPTHIFFYVSMNYLWI